MLAVWTLLEGSGQTSKRKLEKQESTLISLSTRISSLAMSVHLERECTSFCCCDTPRTKFERGPRLQGSFNPRIDNLCIYVPNDSIIIVEYAHVLFQIVFPFWGLTAITRDWQLQLLTAP